MFCEEDYLADVVGIVSDLTIDCLHYGMRFTANVNSFCEVGVGKRFERAEDPVPACIPLFHQFGAGCSRRFKFRIAVAVGFFAVAGEEVAPPRAHVAGHVFNDDGDRIGFLIYGFEELSVSALRHRAFGESFVIAKNIERIFEVRIGAYECHRWKF